MTISEGYVECGNCGAPLTDDVERPARDPWCSPGCREVLADDDAQERAEDPPIEADAGLIGIKHFDPETDDVQRCPRCGARDPFHSPCQAAPGTRVAQ
jgi:endogenous inhibitor of DNA gyrase (YacG/DUF329 family)